MKLLIVDDEKITREGLVNSIDWNALGITSILQADDGLHGLEVAETFHPDIVLSDIRMPRLNGIDMAYRLQKTSPNLSLIFMSGYSDKEYLKAAIKLKAVTYVEKPINPKEIIDAIKDACNEVERLKKTATSTAISISYSKAMLASKLSYSTQSNNPFPNAQNLDFSFPLTENVPFFTMIIKFWSNLVDLQIEEDRIHNIVISVLKKHKLDEIHFLKQDKLFIYHIWGFKDFTNTQKQLLGTDLILVLHEPVLKYHILIGKNIMRAYNIFYSYNSAVIEMQNSFFYPENTYLIYEHHDHYTPFFALNHLVVNTRLYDTLIKKEKGQAFGILTDLFEQLLSQKNVLPNQVKELYYSLFQEICSAYTVLQIEIARTDEKDNFWGMISACESIYQLQKLLLEKLELFFIDTENYVESNSTVYLIKEFIAKHYPDITLSIKDISEHVFLSSSYICTLFKDETGMTLNQYLTDYRIERAKKLLADPRNKIIDISTSVGYSDGNYFGKAFKKMVGMSPSEYRELENK